MQPTANRPEIECPHCGAPLEIRSPAAVLAICSYCQTASYWDEEAIHVAGQQSALSEGFTRLYRGAEGSVAGERFEVVGRIRYRSSIALWDEWFCQLGERAAWITEDDHALALQAPFDHDQLATIAQHAPGQRFKLDGRLYEVDEVGTAETIGVEGQLPERILEGEVYRFLNASSLDGELTLGIELDDVPPSGFLGRWLPHAEVVLDDEGDDW